MCYHKQNRATATQLSEHYQIPTVPEHQPVYHESGFSHGASILLTSQSQKEFTRYQWGLIPWWVKNELGATQIRTKTLNAISEEMYEKPSFRDAAKKGQRCLIPCTGFFEWRWFKGGKVKYPYFIHLADQMIFSLGGLYSEWENPNTNEKIGTYTVLTTAANPLLKKIHNSKERMPVIIPRQFEKDWIGQSLSQDDVLALCQPFDHQKMEAYTVSKMITDRRVLDKNVPAVFAPTDYPEIMD